MWSEKFISILIRGRLKHILMLLLIGLAATGTLKASEFEVWTFAGAGADFEKSDLSVHSANFFQQDGNYFLNHTQLSLDFHSKRAISFGIGYKQEYVKFPGFWREEFRPMLHLYYTKLFGAFEFRDRSRLEFRFMEGDMINRYRNQLQLTFIRSKWIVPYFSTEFSFYFNKLDYTRQRTILGAVVPLKNLNLNLFLGHQVNEDFPDDWNTKIMLGTGLKYSF